MKLENLTQTCIYAVSLTQLATCSTQLDLTQLELCELKINWTYKILVQNHHTCPWSLEQIPNIISKSAFLRLFLQFYSTLLYPGAKSASPFLGKI